ncbi:MAG: sulfotransferase domain-containing protein [Verrucomicrobiota bacterium]
MRLGQWRWNFSSRARELSGGDAIVISIPKSGRTWVRTFICSYYCQRDGYPFSLEPEKYAAGIPRIIFSHDRFEQRTKASLWDHLRGKYLIPAKELARQPIVLLVRDPRDAFVSLYVQLVRRTRETPQTIKQTSASDLLRDGRFGLRSIVGIMNGWLDEFSARAGFTMVRYESLHAEPAEHFRKLLAVIGEASPDVTAFAHALAFSEFGNMKKLETAGAFASKILRPGDALDPESYKVRRGKVGGYVDYLDEADLKYADEVMRELNPRFGYATEL